MIVVVEKGRRAGEDQVAKACETYSAIRPCLSFAELSPADTESANSSRQLGFVLSSVGLPKKDYSPVQAGLGGWHLGDCTARRQRPIVVKYRAR